MRLAPAIAAQIPIPALAPEESAELEAGDADEAALGPDVIVDITAVDTIVVMMVRAVGAGMMVDEVIVAKSWIAPRERRGSLLQLHWVLLFQQQYSPPWQFCSAPPVFWFTAG